MPGLFHPLVGDQVINAKQRVQYVSSTQVYYGYAAPGTAEDAEGWLIVQETLDAQGRTTQMDFAASTSEYINIWTNRATYTYG